MEKLNLYRTALDALYFLLTQLPGGLVTDSSKIVLRKIVSDVMTQMSKLYVMEEEN